MTTEDPALATAASESVPSAIAQLVHEKYPEELAVLGIPICCIDSNSMWAVPVRFQCGTYYVALCRPEASTVQIVSPPSPVRKALRGSQRLPTLTLVDGTLQIVVHTDQGDRAFPF